jgi:hypothetical protein
VPEGIWRLLHGIRPISCQPGRVVDPPDVFASSNLVERGRCRNCGTPLSYRQIDGPNISLTINSLDDPESVRPQIRFAAKMEVSWCGSLSTLPTREMDFTATPGFVNRQFRAD